MQTQAKYQACYIARKQLIVKVCIYLCLQYRDELPVKFYWRLEI